ncbi:MAG TPA: GlsB/YeaQ/YmgE family stress response membrane protein [Gemmatimonadaceae bacterium]|nr:GlsB/YeaQ/YmgE family stress response membrane protein [Gemmatimonadaceae bacterium]
MRLWLYWIILGLLAGSLAKWILPGRDPAGCIFTIFLGIVGAFVGGVIGAQLGWGAVSQGTFDLRSLALATLGAIVLLLIGRLFRRSLR